MASKVEIAKREQGFIQKPVFPMCSNCKHFQSELKKEEGTFETWVKEINVRCGIGGFKIGKNSTCNKHETK